jgi:hypothetical protein
MITTIYLDQNIISDLRERSILKMDSNKAHLMERLRERLESPEIKVVYSHVTLLEIFQISKVCYQTEHIEVLNSLKASYIEPSMPDYSFLNAFEVWSGYLNIMQENVVGGLDDLESINRTLVQKVNGLNVDETFEEIYVKLNTELSKIVIKEQDFLKKFKFDELSSNEKCKYYSRKNDLTKLKSSIDKLKVIEIPLHIEPDPRFFREIPMIKKLQVERLHYSEAVKEIELVFCNTQGGSCFLSAFSKTEKGAVSKAYSLLNWAGYYADDFQKTNKVHGDRLNASINDLCHVVASINSDIILTEDKGLLRKAPACYAHIKKNVSALSIKDFLIS